VDHDCNGQTDRTDGQALRQQRPRFTTILHCAAKNERANRMAMEYRRVNVSQTLTLDPCEPLQFGNTI